MATDPLSNFRSSPFVSQYKGLPIDAFQQSATVLQNRAIQNKDQMDKLDMLAYETAVYGNEDEAIKQAQIKKIRDEQERIAATGAYERSGDLVRMQGKEFAQNTQLNSARSSAKNIAASQAKASEFSPVQQAIFQQRLQGYSGVGEADEFGKYNIFTEHNFYEDPDLQGAIDELVDGWEADKKSWVSNAQKAGYITSGSVESVTEEEVRNAAIQMLQANPMYRRAIEDNARYRVYQATGDLDAMVGSPMAVVGQEEYKDKDGNIKVRDITAYEQELMDLVTPYAQRESYKRTEADMKADGTYMAFRKEALDKKPIVPVIKGSAINPYGNYGYNEWNEELTASAAAVQDLRTALNNTSVDNPETRKSLENQIKAEEAKQQNLKNIQEEFLKTQSFSSSDQKDLDYYLSTQFLPDISNVGDGDDIGGLGKGDVSTVSVSNPAIQEHIQAFKEVYGEEAFNKRVRNGQIMKSVLLNASGRDLANTSIFKNNDFGDFLETKSEAFGYTPDVLPLGEESEFAEAFLQKGIMGGNVTVSGSTRGDSSPYVLDALRALSSTGDLVIMGPAFDNSGRIAVQIPQINLEDKKYANLSKKAKEVIEEANKIGSKQLFVDFEGSEGILAATTQNYRNNIDVTLNNPQTTPVNREMAFKQKETLDFYEAQTPAKQGVEEALSTDLPVELTRPGNRPTIVVEKSNIDNEMVYVKDLDGNYVIGSDGRKALFTQQGVIKTFFTPKN